MKLFRFDQEVGRPIHQYYSNFLLAPVLRLEDKASVVCMHLPEGGEVGYHEAKISQLFLVVQGSGWVIGDDQDRVPIQAGQAAFWVPGEWHGAGTETGMTAIVIEYVNEMINPADFMQEVEVGV